MRSLNTSSYGCHSFNKNPTCELFHLQWRFSSFLTPFKRDCHNVSMYSSFQILFFHGVMYLIDKIHSDTWKPLKARYSRWTARLFCIWSISLFWCLMHPRRGLPDPPWRSPEPVPFPPMLWWKWFISGFSKTKHKLFTNKSIIHLSDGFLISLREPFGFSKKRGSPKIKVFELKKFGRPCFTVNLTMPSPPLPKTKAFTLFRF